MRYAFMLLSGFHFDFAVNFGYFLLFKAPFRYIHFGKSSFLHMVKLNFIAIRFQLYRCHLNNHFSIFRC